MPRVERGISSRDGVEALSKRGSRLGDALPTVAWDGHLGGRRRRHLIDHLARNWDDIVFRGALNGIACGPVERRPLTAGTLSEHIAQTQENEHRQRQKNDRI